MQRYWHFIIISLLGFILSLNLNNYAFSQNNNHHLIQAAQQQYQQRQFEQSLKLLEQVNQELATVNEHLQQAQIQSLISLNHQQLGNWQQAQQAIDYSLALIATEKETNHKQQILGQIWNSQGHLYLRKGEPQKALESWSKAQAYYENIADTVAIRGITVAQTQALESLGFYRRSCSNILQLFLEDTKDCQQIEEKEISNILESKVASTSELQIEALSSLANNLMLLGKLTPAQQIINHSQALLEQGNIQSSLLNHKVKFTAANIAQAIANLAKERADTPLFIQETQKAIALYNEILNTTDAKQTVDTLEAVANLLDIYTRNAYDNLASSLLENNRLSFSAITTNYRTLKIKLLLAKSLSTLKINKPSISQSWTDIVQLYQEISQQAHDINNYYLESSALGELGKIAYEQKLSLNIDPQLYTEQALQIAQTNQAPEIAYRWQWQLGRIYRDRQDTEMALAAYQAAFATLQNLRNDLIALDREIQFSFRQQVEPVYREYTKLLLVEQTPEKIADTDNLKKARNVIEALQIAELDNYFKDACITSQQRNIEDIDPTAAVIYTIILSGNNQAGDRLETILSLPDGSFHHHETIVDSSQLSNTVNQLNSYLLQPDRLYDVNLLSHQVYDWLIKPLESTIAQSSPSISTLVFVLDGELQSLPPSALYDGQQYLLEKYAIAITPGLRLLNAQPASNELTALAGGVSQKREQFPALKNVPIELQKINSTLNSQNLLDAEFNSDNLSQLVNSQPFSVVHLATHGQFSSNPEQTFIVLWDGRLTIDNLSYLLQNRNLENSQIIDLLVLSACETARGDGRAALGLAGMSVRTGASSTLATLWQISDRSTAVLMDNFYSYLSQNPQMSKAEALRLAQLDLWQVTQQDWQVPLFWAAYVMVGNWL